MSCYQKTVAMLALGLVLSACATGGKSTLLGAGVGSGLGAGIGALADPGPKGRDRIRNVFIGAAAGGLLGAGAGYLAHGVVEKHEGEAYEKGKKDGEKTPAPIYAGNGAEPVLTPARVESRYVDDQIRGNVFVPAHFEYMIVEPARWRR